MYELRITDRFSAAHRLRDYPGECERLHGHNWKIDFEFESEQLNEIGLVADFRDLKKIIKEALAKYDHRYLNDLTDFIEINTSTENVARLIFEKVSRRLPKGINLSRVTAWESENCGASYRPPEHLTGSR
jgi:6-pyruvoyltetrahydropterin/6-carboxytetrahydropterin synthase